MTNFKGQEIAESLNRKGSDWRYHIKEKRIDFFRASRIRAISPRSVDYTDCLTWGKLAKNFCTSMVTDGPTLMCLEDTTRHSFLQNTAIDDRSERERYNIVCMLERFQVQSVHNLASLPWQHSKFFFITPLIYFRKGALRIRYYRERFCFVWYLFSADKKISWTIKLVFSTLIN